MGGACQCWPCLPRCVLCEPPSCPWDDIQIDALPGRPSLLAKNRSRSAHSLNLQAYNAFTPDQRQMLRRHVADIHHAPIDTLEHIGGGGVRCALGEIF